MFYFKRSFGWGEVRASVSRNIDLVLCQLFSVRYIYQRGKYFPTQGDPWKLNPKHEGPVNREQWLYHKLLSQFSFSFSWKRTGVALDMISLFGNIRD